MSPWSVMTGGYHVDLAALRAVAHGVRGVVEQVRVGTPGPVGAATGHDGLRSALDGFLAGWHDGLRDMTTDALSLADHVEADERAYRAAEVAGARTIGSVLDGRGPDPAAG